MTATCSNTDLVYLREAIELAKKGLYTTDPNPRVGCVIVHKGEVTGRGWHQYAGGPHAEVVALKQSAGRTCGATVYTSLEPCVHQNLTGPCTGALIQARVKTVVAAGTDPNPRVAGKGFQRLREAGIEVLPNLLPKEAVLLNPGYYKRLQAFRPLVRLKMAATLDGRIADAQGQSQWITGTESRADVQYWRARSSAIVTGSGTVMHDNPALTVRDSRFACKHPVWANGLRQPLRVVLDRRNQISKKARVFQGPGQSLWLTTRPLVDTPENVELLVDDDWRPERVLARLAADYSCNELLVEAGSRLAGAFLEAGLVDEIVLYMAPSLLGHTGLGLLELKTIDKLANRLRLEIREVSQIGKDIRILAHPLATAG